MSKRHFERIAAIIARARDEGDAATADRIAADLAAYFATANPRFDRERFIASTRISAREIEKALDLEGDR